MADILQVIAGVEWIVLGVVAIRGMRRWNRRLSELYDEMTNEMEGAEKMEKWISVEDGLPVCDEACLVCYSFVPGSGQRFISCLNYYATDENPHWQHEGLNGLTVSHWLPLPAPPEEGEP